ncbi:hypothetical protein [Nitrospirillum sp. BR 11163]|uniref:hypothetical protein n=1 Tax=Nitrospirillum sp. BR 11163 TaxID=3104323 RepID=UPI002AFEFEBC|nr:hypothetical protein [Nitrospirillum sp. BR 11163]MEA1674105.1 hypothetical protein [Nitrospirillum sp. BR 11163]
MIKQAFFAATAFTIFSTQAVAAPPTEVCQKFMSVIDGKMRLAAYVAASAAGDNSTARATTAYTLAQNHITVAQINLTAALSLGCPAPTRPITDAAYQTQALNCHIAIMQGEKNPAACRIDTWQPDQ